MPRPATGQVCTHQWRDGATVSFYLRVPALGRRWRVDLGTNVEGWSRERAEIELDRVMREIRRGTWQPPDERRDAEPLPAEETVHVTLSRWWQRRRGEVADRTVDDYQWRIGHVLKDRTLVHAPTAELDARAVDEFRDRLRARGLAPRSTNMVLGLLAQVLDDAVEYGLLDANPARGRRRKARETRTRPVFLEPDMIVDLLDEAGRQEAAARPSDRYGRRALLATLMLAGPRIMELIEADRGGLDVHAGVLRLGKKTAAGRDRTLELSAFLLDELRAHLAAVPAGLRDEHGPALPVFPTRTGRRHSPSNVRRLVGKVVEPVNERRAAEGRLLLPARVTLHTLRKTYASLCFFAGRDLRWVMGQLGHDDPKMTLGVYAQTMRRSRVDEALVWRLMRLPHEHEARSTGRIGPANGPTSIEVRPVEGER